MGQVQPTPRSVMSFVEVSQAERESGVPAHARHDHLFLGFALPEQGGESTSLRHVIKSLAARGLALLCLNNLMCLGLG